MLSHLPRRNAVDDDEQKTEKSKAEDQKTEDLPVFFKTFGFFDLLQIEEVKAASLRLDGQRNEPRHQRTLFAFGPKDRLKRLLIEVRDQPRYLAMVLVKLQGHAAHQGFAAFVHDRLAEVGEPTPENTAYLGCLDSTDMIILRVFGQQAEGPPVENLMRWLGELRRTGVFAQKIERSLTIVCCSSLPVFIDTLAEMDAKSSAQAIVRVTDLRNGRALAKLRAKVEEQPEYRKLMREKLYASVGYYDIQGITTVQEAAVILRAADLVAKEADNPAEYAELTTSTCLIGYQNLEGAIPPAERTEGPSPLMPELQKFGEELRMELGRLEEAKLLNSAARDAALEAVAKFHKLHDTGLIPGSRLLRWTCLDAVKCFLSETREHLNWRHDQRWLATNDQDHDFHTRQRDFGFFFRAISSELDRRVSLSLPAHTRQYPSTIEAPLKMVGALDVAGRLIGASFRCYKCRTKSGTLPVFTTTWDKPQFTALRRGGANRESERPAPFATMVVTTFTPPLVQHFYLSLFTVFHEVAQCIIEETIGAPTFTGLVYTQALIERTAAISTLVCRQDGRHRQCSIPRFIRTWANDFLAEELAAGSPIWTKIPAPLGPDYFADGQEPPRPNDDTWEADGIWQSQAEVWVPHRVGPNTPDWGGVCSKLVRDSRFCTFLIDELNQASFRQIWAHELHVRFAAVARVSPKPERGRRQAEFPTDEFNEANLAIQKWSEVCSLPEYLELASLLPFLRLFDGDSDTTILVRVTGRLVRDCCAVWRDSVDPSVMYDSARRFVIAVAAVDLFIKQRDHTDLGSSLSAEADKLILSCVEDAAAALSHHVDQLPGGRARAVFDVVWKKMAERNSVNSANPTPEEMFTEPLIVVPMVRFLVRLLHIYRLDGPHVAPEAKECLADLNEYMKRIFMRDGQEGDTTSPPRDLATLWSLQYWLTEEIKDINYLFDLKTAMHGLSKLHADGNRS